MIKKLFIQSVLFLHLAAFVFSFSAYALHQLEHLNDIVCVTKDVHYHSSAHQDNCKDLNFFTLQSFQTFVSYHLFIFKNYFLRFSEIVSLNQKGIALFAPRSPPLM